MSGITEVHRAGCSKRLSNKAAASAEARRYVPHIVCDRSSLQQVLANGKAPLVFPISEKLNVEPLGAARTPLAEFFSILLERAFWKVAFGRAAGQFAVS